MDPRRRRSPLTAALATALTAVLLSGCGGQRVADDPLEEPRSGPVGGEAAEAPDEREDDAVAEVAVAVVRDYLGEVAEDELAEALALLSPAAVKAAGGPADALSALEEEVATAQAVVEGDVDWAVHPVAPGEEARVVTAVGELADESGIRMGVQSWVVRPVDGRPRVDEVLLPAWETAGGGPGDWVLPLETAAEWRAVLPEEATRVHLSIGGGDPLPLDVDPREGAFVVPRPPDLPPGRPLPVVLSWTAPGAELWRTAPGMILE